jgi:polar amino acid transport system substrate-binding protein
MTSPRMASRSAENPAESPGSPAQRAPRTRLRRALVWAGGFMLLGFLLLGAGLFLAPLAGLSLPVPMAALVERIHTILGRTPVPEPVVVTPTEPPKPLMFSHFRIRPPVMTQYCSGQFSGPYYHVTEELARRMGYEVDWTVQPFATSLEALRVGTVDVIAFLTYTVARDAFIYYAPTPVGHASKIDAFLVRKGQEGRIQKYEDLYGLRIGQLPATAYFTRFAQDTELNKINLQEYPDLALAFSRREIDAAIVQNPARMEAELARLRESDYAYADYRDIQNEYYYLGFSRTGLSQEYLDTVTRILAEMEEDGTIASIYHSFGQAAPPPRPEGWTGY